MKPEEKAREIIDDLLSGAGWSVQDYQNEDFRASLGIAVREFQLKTGAVDYLLSSIAKLWVLSSLNQWVTPLEEWIISRRSMLEDYPIILYPLKFLFLFYTNRQVSLHIFGT